MPCFQRRELWKPSELEANWNARARLIWNWAHQGERKLWHEKTRHERRETMAAGALVLLTTAMLLHARAELFWARAPSLPAPREYAAVAQGPPGSGEIYALGGR